MQEERSVRIDKWLWAVRIFKTRSQATDACRKGRILIGNAPVKPSRNIHRGEIIIVKKLPVIYTYRVKETLAKRVSAKTVKDFAEDLTPESEIIKLEKAAVPRILYRRRGEGRPTKKERRTIDRFRDPDHNL